MRCSTSRWPGRVAVLDDRGAHLRVRVARRRRCRRRAVHVDRRRPNAATRARRRRVRAARPAPRRCARRGAGPAWRIVPGVCGEPRHDAGHRHVPTLRRRDPPHHVAGEVLRVGEHVGRGEDAAGGHAVLVERREQLVARRGRRPRADDAGRARPCSRPARRASRSAGRRPARVRPSPCTAGRTRCRRWRRSRPRRRRSVGYTFDGATPGSTLPERVAHDAAELVVGHRRLHQRGDGLVDRDVDLLALAGRRAPRRARTACRSRANTDASASPRLMPARDGGRSGLPVVWRMPPIASPTLPKPACPASGPGLAEAADVRHHQPRVGRRQRGVVEAPAFEHARPEVLEHDVALRREPAGELACRAPGAGRA